MEKKKTLVQVVVDSAFLDVFRLRKCVATKEKLLD